MQGSKRLIRARGKSAIYELRVSTGRDPVTGRYDQVSRRWPRYAGDDTEVDSADKFLAKLVKELEGSGRTAGAGGTVDRLLAKWLKQITSESRSPTTLREYQRLIDKRISPALGHVPARKVTALELDEFYQGLTDEGLAAASVRQGCTPSFGPGTVRAPSGATSHPTPPRTPVRPSWRASPAPCRPWQRCRRWSCR